MIFSWQSFKDKLYLIQTIYSHKIKSATHVRVCLPLLSCAYLLITYN